MGSCHSSVDSSASSILLPWVWVPSTPPTLLPIYIWIVSCGKNENKQKEAGIGPYKNYWFRLWSFGDRLWCKHATNSERKLIGQRCHHFLFTKIWTFNLVTLTNLLLWRKHTTYRLIPWPWTGMRTNGLPQLVGEGRLIGFRRQYRSFDDGRNRERRRPKLNRLIPLRNLSNEFCLSRVRPTQDVFLLLLIPWLEQRGSILRVTLLYHLCDGHTILC